MARKTDIRLRRSNTAGAIPSGSHLNEGELAINTADGALYFKKSDSTVITAHDNTIMHIDSDAGNSGANPKVGILTTSPATTLDVDGGITGSGLLKINEGANLDGHTIGRLVINYQSNGNPALASHGGDTVHIEDDLMIQGANLTKSTTAPADFKIRQARTGYDIVFQTAPSTNSTFVDAMKIQTDGNVGIGTASPDVKLHLEDSSRVDIKFEKTGSETHYIRKDGDYLRFRGHDDSTVLFELQNNTNGSNVSAFPNGSVGIGNNSPDFKLDVAGDGRFYGQNNLLYLDSGTTGSPLMQFRQGTTRRSYIRFENSRTAFDLINEYGGISFWTGTSGSEIERIQIDTTGHLTFVGDNRHIYFGGSNTFIGENSNSNKLELRGGGSNTAATVYIDNTGQMGLGTSAPGAKLHVTGGDILIDNNNSLSFENAAGAKRDILTYNSSNKVRLDNPGGSTVDLNSDTLIVHRHGRIVTGKAGQTWTNGYSRNISIQNITDSTNNGFGVWNAFIGTNLRYDTTNNTFVRATDEGSRNWGNIAAQFFNGGGSNTSAAIDWVTDIPNESVSDGSEVNVSGSTLVGLSKMTLTTGGSLGIGTRSPQGTLHLRDTTARLYVQSNDGSSAHITFGDATDVSRGGIEYTSTDDLVFSNNNFAERMRIRYTGDIGIGTSLPSDKLHLNGAANAATGLTIGNNNSTRLRLYHDDNAGASLLSTDAVGTEQQLRIRSGSFLALDTGGTSERVRILSDGKVIIGDTASHTTDLLQIETPASGGGHGIQIRRNDANNDQGIGHILFGNNTDTDLAKISAKTDLDNNAGDSGALLFSTQPTSGSLTERLRINSVGQVGIGTTSPSVDAAVEITKAAPNTGITTLRLTNSVNNRGQRIDFVDDNAARAFTVTHDNGGNNAIIGTIVSEPLLFLTNNTERVRITSGGDVGIGTTSPDTPLHVFSSGTTQAKFVRDLTTDVGLTIGNDNSGVVFGTIGVHNYQFYANGARRLNISSTGAVTFNEAFTFPTSIGSAGQILKVPSSGTNLIWADDAGGGSATVVTDTDGDTKIQVEESADEDIIRFDTAGTQRMVITDAGRVGINIQSPAAMLHVNGGIVAVGDGTNTTYYEEDKIHSYATSGFTIDGREGITLETTSDDKDINFKIYDTTNGLETYMSVDGGEGRVVFNKWTRHVDNARILIGTGGDLSLYHDGTHSFVSNTQGSLYIRSSNTVQIENSSGNDMITAQSGGAVTLFYNAFSKLATKSDGVDITGELQSDSLDVDGNADISGNLVLGGNLTVNGTTTTINAATLDVEDKNITLNYGSGDTSASANGAGITIQDAVNSTTDATILWDATNDEFDFSHPIKVAGSLGVTNIVTNKVVKFNGSILDDSNITDDGSTITLGSNTVINGTSNFNGGVSVNVDSSSTGFGNHQAALRIDNTNTTTNNWAALVFDSNNGSSAEVSARFTDHANNYADLYFANRGSGGYTTKMVILQNGNVGIGITNPEAPLDIVKSSSSIQNMLKLQNTNTTAGAGTKVLFQGRDNIGNAVNYGQIVVKHTNTTTEKSELQFWHMKNASPNQAITVNQDGNVGIGVTSPGGHLDVNGTYGDLKVGDPSVGTRLTYYNSQRILMNSNDIMFYTNSLTERMRIKNDGKVGIGTNAPADELHVNGSGDTTVRVTTSSTSLEPKLVFVDGSGDYASLEKVNRDIKIKAFNTDVAYFTNGGTVGIGTTSPNAKLHVNNTSSGNFVEAIRIENSGGGANEGGYINWEVANTSGHGARIGGRREGTGGIGLHFYTGEISSAPAERMRISHDGNVGIGTNAPSQKLDVAGHININTPSGASQSGYALRLNKTNSSSQVQLGAELLASPWASNTNGGNLIIKTANSSGTATNAMAIDGAQNVGIGTTSPSHKLHVNGGALFNTNTGSNPVYITRSGATDQALKIYTDDANAIFESIQDESLDNYGGFIFAMDAGTTEPFFDIRKGTSSGGTKFRVDGSGDIGIGTTTLNSYSNQRVVTINGTTHSRIDFETGGTLRGSVYGDSGSLNLDAGSNYIRFYTGNTEKMRLKSNGFLGIGTDTPLDLIHIKSTSTDARQVIDAHTGYDAELKFAENGTVAYTIGHNAADDTFRIGTTNVDTSPRFVIDSSGNVGINENPRFKLSVKTPAIPSGSTYAWPLDLSRPNTENRGLTFGIAASGTTNAIAGHNADVSIGHTYGTDSNGLPQYYETLRVKHIDQAVGNVGIGVTDPKAKFQVEEYGIDTSSTSTSATTQVAIHTFPIADFRTARFTIQITNTTDSTYHSTEIIAVHDGTTANITEFGEVHTGSSVEATFDADISSNNFRLLATPASTDSMTFKVVCHSITV